MSEAMAIPDGFRELRRANSPYLTSLGTLYAKGEGSGMVIAMRIGTTSASQKVIRSRTSSQRPGPAGAAKPVSTTCRPVRVS